MKTIPYGHQWVDKKDIQKVVSALKSNWLTQGPKANELEDALCKYTGAKYAVVVSSGTAALHTACLAVGIKQDDEVITSPITFVASANCILYCGGRPVFADVQEDTANIDPLEIKKKINRKTKAIIPVHFAGHPCDLKEIRSVAKKHNLLMIEDAAHALGSRYRGSKIGSCDYSDVCIFSFHPIKSITTGEGGAVLTNNKYLYQRLLMFRNHGIIKKSLKSKDKKLNTGWFYKMQELGFNYRLTDFQSALGLSQLQKIDRFIKIRKKIVNIYNQKLSIISDISLPIERPYVASSWHLYCIRLKEKQRRKSLFRKLHKSGIGVQVHYIPVYFHPYYQKLGYKNHGLCPKAENFYKEEITIPLYPSMKKQNIQYVADTIANLLKG